MEKERKEAAPRIRTKVDGKDVHHVGQGINRYNTGMDVVKTMECFESIPGRLSKTNKRFHCSDVGTNGGGSRKSADVYGGNLLWIKNAGYGNFVHGLKQMAMPLSGRSKRETLFPERYVEM